MKHFGWVMIVGYLVGLMVYVWVGFRSVPFHGDEADHLYKSIDFNVAFVKGHPQDLRTMVPADPNSTEHIRLLTGNIHAILSGYALWSMGVQPQDWPRPWDYGQSVEANVDASRWPAPDILERGRVPHTLLVMLSVPLAFVMVRYWKPAYVNLTGVVAATLIATHPAWLLSGRRVMQEAVLVVFSLILVWLAMAVAQRWRVSMVMLIGAVGGVCIAGKPTGLITVAAVFLALGLVAWFASQRWQRVCVGVVAGLICIATYLILTPSTWGNPPHVVRFMVEERRAVMDSQRNNTPLAYDSFDQQVTALIEQPFLSDLQYYETPAFAGALNAEIAFYTRRGFAGWQMCQPIALMWTGMAGIGLVQLWRQRHQSAAVVGLIWIVATGATLAISVPMDWRRYYLLWDVAICLAAAYGFDTILQWLNGWKSFWQLRPGWLGSL